MGLGLQEGATRTGWSGLKGGVLVKGFRVGMAPASVLKKPGEGLGWILRFGKKMVCRLSLQQD